MNQFRTTDRSTSSSSGPIVAARARRCALILGAVLLLAGVAHAAWYDSAWEYRKAITIDPAGVPTDQTDFPVLVVLTADADLLAHAQPDGDDLLFTAADGSTKLSHEIERYDGGTGTLVAWVKVPALSGSIDTEVLLYYGNGSVGSQEDGANVWIANYGGVWHLDEDQADTGHADVYQDSSIPFNHGIDHVASTGQDGKIGRGQQFSGDGDYIGVPHHASLDLTGPMTLSFWIKLSADAGEWNRVVEKGMGGFTSSYYLGGGDGTNDITYYLANTAVIDTADDLLSIGDWHHVAATYAGNGDVTLILDGTAEPSVNYAGTVPGNTDTLYISHPQPDYDLEGYLDEIRIVGADLGADWVITEFNNQDDPGGFYAVGDPTRVIRGRVFEDQDFAGSAADWDALGDHALGNVDVELYDADGGDALVASVSTGIDGIFTFVGLDDGNYKVRIRTATIGDADTAPAAGLNAGVPGTWPYPLPEMAWGNGAALYGGQDVGIDDADTGDDAGPGDTWVAVTVNGADVDDVNFGFVYDLIVNTIDDGLADAARSDQGSFRQFIKNANAIVGMNKTWFRVGG